MKIHSRSLGLVLAATLFATSAFAADTAPANAPLPAGKPAGVQSAQLGGMTLVYIGVIAAVGAFIGLTTTSGPATGFTTGTVIAQH